MNPGGFARIQFVHINVCPVSYRPYSRSPRSFPLLHFWVNIMLMWNVIILMHIYLASCYRFSCYYRFSDIAINSVNPSFIWRLEFSKNGWLNISLYIRLFLKPFLYFNILSIIWQLLLSVKWRYLFSCEVITRPIYGMETNIKSGNGWF
jgi:hypothetical protein